MYYVYVMQSGRTGELYFGRTNDLERRLTEHNHGNTYSTADKRPWAFVYVEGYRDKRDAVVRESQLKQYGNARTYIKRRLRNSIQGAG